MKRFSSFPAYILMQTWRDTKYKVLTHIYELVQIEIILLCIVAISCYKHLIELILTMLLFLLL